MSFWYLASPYWLYPGGLAAAHKIACENAALLMREGIPVFSPIAHSHPIAMAGGLDPHGEMWVEQNRPMMAAAYGIIVLMADGFEQSEGIEVERRVFRIATKQEILMTPGRVDTVLSALPWHRWPER